MKTKNVLKRKPVLLLLLIAIAVLFSGCTLLEFLGLLPRDTQEITGIMSGYAYSDVYASSSEIGEDVEINSILHISGPGSDYYLVTEADGSYSVTDLEEGSYTIAPVYFEYDYSRTVTVSGGETTFVDDIIFPAIGFEAYLFRTDTSPLNNVDVRKALAGSINVIDLVTYSDNTSYSAAVHFIPPSISGGWNTDAVVFEFDHDQSLASGITEPITIELLHNESDAHAGRASLAVSAMNQLSGVTVTATSVDWNTYLSRLGSGNFYIARLGWILESNNLIGGLEAITNNAAYTNVDFAFFISEARSAIESGNLAEFETNIVAASDVLVNSVVALPIFYRNPAAGPLPLEEIDGIWTIDSGRSLDIPTSGSSYSTLDFDTSSSTPHVTVADETGNVFETNTIDSLSGTTAIADQVSFDVTITQQDDNPSYVGGQNYWEYYFLGDLLVIDVFDDSTRSTRFVRFVAVR